MASSKLPSMSPEPTRLWSDVYGWIEKPKKLKRSATKEEKIQHLEEKYIWFTLLRQTTWYFEKKVREKKLKQLSSSDAHHRRRTRIKNLPNEKINLLKVFERDGWICKLCGNSVSKLEDRNLVDIASLDHIVPISKGGAHTYENVQLAHLSCNIRKGNRVPLT